MNTPHASPLAPALSTAFAPAPADPAAWARYEPRMRHVIAHVHDHLDEPLDLSALAEIACLSPHHWHRVYHAMFGETLARSVKRLRLHRAAGRLAQTELPIARIAADAGYPNLQSFTRTFQVVYGMPPARYRAAGDHQVFRLDRAPCESPGFEVTVQAFDDQPVLAVDHAGSYMAIARAFDLLFTRVVAAGLARPGMRMLAMFLDDPTAVPEDALRARATVAGCGPAPADAGLAATTIAGGTYAVLVHVGPYASMKAAYQWLYGDWLPRSGHEPADAPVVEEYLNSPRDTAPADLRTRICLPLKGPPPRCDGPPARRLTA